VLPFLLHAWRRWPRPRKVDLISRRAALKLLGVSAAALSAWWLSEILAGLRNLAEVPERLTGSRRQGYLSGNHFPITHTKAASKERTDPAIWRLRLVGALKEPLEFTYQQLLAHPVVEKEVILDCTLGWYTVQRWRGIPLQTLFEEAGISKGAVVVQLKSVTGYARSLPMREARGVLLATHVGDEELDYAHGYPIRAVVPSRRGWYWVKWLGRIEVL
jgi:DMSO/TMAO reductase YedYZ molybdopterin-dependent catalytic subunit